MKLVHILFLSIVIIFTLCYSEFIEYPIFKEDCCMILNPILSVKPFFIEDEYIFKSLLENMVHEISYKYNVDVNLVKAIIKVESDWNHLAVSKRGAKGLMQLMPDTAKELNIENIFDPKDNIKGGVKYLKYLLNRFDDIRLVLAAYNSGPSRVSKLKRIPRIKETKNYIVKVLKEYEYYKLEEKRLALLKNN